MAPSENTHTVYESAILIDSEKALDSFISGVKEADWCDQAEGHKPDSSDTSVLAVTNIAVFGFRINDGKNFGAAKKLPNGILKRPDITPLNKIVIQGKEKTLDDDNCVYWSLALGMYPSLTKKDQSNIFNRRKLSGNRTVPKPDWDSLEVKMEEIKKRWKAEVHPNQSSLEQFYSAEDVFEININVHLLTDQERVKNKQRAVHSEQVIASPGKYEDTVNIALYKGHCMWINDIDAYLLAEDLTCQECNRRFTRKSAADRHKQHCHPDGLRASGGRKKFVPGKC